MLLKHDDINFVTMINEINMMSRLLLTYSQLSLRINRTEKIHEDNYSICFIFVDPG